VETAQNDPVGLRPASGILLRGRLRPGQPRRRRDPRPSLRHGTPALFSQYCFGCHGAKKHKGDLEPHAATQRRGDREEPPASGSRFAAASTPRNAPRDASKQARRGRTRAALAWLRDPETARPAERRRPGLRPRRLSNAEYTTPSRSHRRRPRRRAISRSTPPNESGFDKTRGVA